MLIAALFSALSLIPVWVAFHWAGRLYGTAGGALRRGHDGDVGRGRVLRPQADARRGVGDFLLAALFLARPGAERRDLFLAGVSFMLALTVRMQIAPAIGVALLADRPQIDTDEHRWFRSRPEPLRPWRSPATIEWLWWGVPFRGHWNYLVMEFAHGASELLRPRAADVLREESTC